MTVKELIEKLSVYNENMEVYVNDTEWGLDAPISIIGEYDIDGEEVLGLE